MLLTHQADYDDHPGANRGNKKPAIIGEPFPNALHRLDDIAETVKTIQHVVALEYLRRCAGAKNPGKNALEPVHVFGGTVPGIFQISC